MNDRRAVTPPNWWIGAIVLAAIGVAVAAIFWIDRTGRRGNRLADEFDYNIDDYKTIDPALLRYEQTLEIPCGLKTPRAVAVDPEDRILVAGDQVVRVFQPDGTRADDIELDAQPRCLAVAPATHEFPGRVYVGMKDHVEVFDAEGRPLATWAGLGDKALLTSIAVAENDLFVADAGNLVVVRYNTSGEVIKRIGDLEENPNARGFVVPSPFFDVAMGSDGLPCIVNPGARRIETYSLDGALERYWGESTVKIEGFFGCCNPANLAVLPDGRFVTAEKGLLRVKVYDEYGAFECVVAGPEQLDAPSASANESLSDQEYTAVDVATDSRGRVLILDVARASVRVFEKTIAD